MNNDVINEKIHNLEKKAEQYSRIAEDVRVFDRRLERLEDHYNAHAKILFNNGQGLLFKLDRLEVAKKNQRWNSTTWIMIASVLTNIAMALIMVLK